MQGGPADARILYDRTDPMVEVPSPGGPPSAPPQAQGPPLDASAQSAPAPLLSSLGSDPGTDALSNVDLQSLAQPAQIMSPEDQQVQQMQMLLDDPNSTPEERSLIEQQVALAARRRMAGL
jgi:hypothetical protein